VFSSVLGRTLLTANAAGTNTSTGNGPLSSFTYDPFGNPLSGSVLPANTEAGSYAFGGTLQKITETSLALKPIQMGARVYLSTLGRFTSVDPVLGGTANAYVYALDPINSSDYSGQCAYFIQCTATVRQVQPAPVRNLQAPANSLSRLQSATNKVQNTRQAQTFVRVAAKPAIRQKNNSTALPAARVTDIDMSRIPQTTRTAAPPRVAPIGNGISLKRIASSASSGCLEGVAAFGSGVLIGRGLMFAAIANPEALFFAVSATCVGGALGGSLTYITTGQDVSGSFMEDAYHGVRF
jgi:RHS repeat-associated protein